MKNTASRCRGYFYPRSPCGERRLSYFYIIKITQFLSTLSLRRATIPDREPAAGYLISIHALLAESDPTRWAPTCRISNFYPRSPCGERLVALLATGRAGYFYPRSPCGERHMCPIICTMPLSISIHALLAESDLDRWLAGLKGTLFLSTLSLRRATEENAGKTVFNLYFYPRSPCGERQRLGLLGWLRTLISIHALLAESDVVVVLHIVGGAGFLSTLSLRRATSPCCGWFEVIHHFYPRSPCGERPLALLFHAA